MKKIILLLMLFITAVTVHAQTYQLFEGEPLKFGLKDESGKVIIEPKYSFISSTFYEGFTWAMINGKTGFINKEGKAITPFKYDTVYDFSNGTAYVNTGAEFDDEYFEFYGGKWGAIDTSGKEIIPLVYDYLGIFNTSGVAVATIGNKYGIINLQNKQVVPIQYEYVALSYAEPQMAMAVVGGKFKESGDYTLSPIVGGKVGFINYVTGKEIVPLKYDNARDFTEGLAAVNIGAINTDTAYSIGKWGYIDATGKIVIPFNYEQAFSFTNGKAKVFQGGRGFYIDKTGKEVQ